MDHGQVKWSKVFVEWEVSKIIVDVEKEGILVVLGRLGA